MLTKEQAWHCLSEIPDPDIPVISITELGLVRNIETDEAAGKVTVSLTPSYSGCPAMKLFEEEIVTALKKEGASDVEVKLVFSPPWTTDWISEAAKEKMKKHGIAPPVPSFQNSSGLFCETKRNVCCPWCNSSDTQRTSQFGSTPCKALWFCNSCHQPFEYFKCY